MSWDSSRCTNKIYSISVMSFRVYFLVYSRWIDWYCTGQFFVGHCSSRYVLCSSTLSLCFKDRGSVCFTCRVCKLVSSDNRVYYKSHLTICAVYGNVCCSKVYHLTVIFFMERHTWWRALPLGTHHFDCFASKKVWQLTKFLSHLFSNEKTTAECWNYVSHSPDTSWTY